MCTGATFDPIEVDTGREDELQFAGNLDAWEIKLRFHAIRHMEQARAERDGTTTLDAASDLVFKRHSELQHSPNDDGAASYECNITLALPC